MPDIPESLMRSLASVAGFDAARFQAAHVSAHRPVAIRINGRKYQGDVDELQALLSARVPWNSRGFYLNRRPAFFLDPLWHGGLYYVQEPSSMSLEFVLKSCCDTTKPLRVLDLCAAPGGKTTLMADLLPHNSLIVANEVITSRTRILEENVVKWGAPHVVVTQEDAKGFGRMKGFFDVIVVDAPCSGSGLFRKDAEALAAWSPEQVIMCSKRQKRILADVTGALKAGGLLVYSTCSFSPEENEDIADFLVQEGGLHSLEVPFDDQWHIVPSTSAMSRSHGYRFYPDKLEGEGFFVACFRKTGMDEAPNQKHRSKGLKNIPALAPAERKVVSPWLQNAGEVQLFSWKDEVWFIAEPLKEALDLLCNQVRVLSPGTRTGKLIREKLIPDHGLAMSCMVAKGDLIDLSSADAVQYLRREAFSLPGDLKGWQLAAYKNYPLGWLKAAGGRVNNYYPMNWRIRKRADQ